MTEQGWDRETLVSCLAKRNTILLRGGVYLYDQTFAKRYPDHFYQHDYLFGDRWKVFLDGVAAQKFFAPSSKIGIVYQDAPESKRTLDNVVKPWLKARHLEIAAEAPFEPYDSTAEGGGLIARTSNTVLRFRQALVDRVLFVEGSVSTPFAFMTHAESQGYRPKYALNTAHNLTFLQGNVPADQLRGSKGVVWGGLPGFPVETSATKLCDRIKATEYCSEFLFLKAVMDRAPALNPRGFRVTVQGLGTSFVSPDTWSSRFEVARYQDGVGKVRPFAFDDGCDCFRYTGGVIPAP
jgi:hypothetical protein